ncbi:MAG: glycosyltransferase family 2 protein [Chloroflexi bacterium]|nr:glycosyltransferase family 2 protein [Chloroflexota bacterium]
MQLSVIIPILNEEENIPALHEELMGVLETLGRTFEVIYVDDGSTDRSFELLRDLAMSDPRIQVIRFRRNFGQTAGLRAGIEASRGDILVFMDGDRQNDPHSIPDLLNKLDEGYDVVSGVRKNRQDPSISRKLPSRLANMLISSVSGVHLRDYGCTLKAYRREVIENVKLYGELHRFIPAYAAWNGAEITELDVGHRARTAGRSKYGLDRTIKVLLDLMTLKFLSDYSTKPIYLFGGLGASFFLAAGGVLLYVLFQLFVEGVKLNRNQPALFIALVFALFGLVLIMNGLLAELSTRTYHESQDKPTYTVRTRIRNGRVVDLRARRRAFEDLDSSEEAVPSGQEGPRPKVGV